MPISASHERRADPRRACSAREWAAICRAERMRRATAIGQTGHAGPVPPDTGIAPVADSGLPRNNCGKGALPMQPCGGTAG